MVVATLAAGASPTVMLTAPAAYAQTARQSRTAENLRLGSDAGVRVHDVPGLAVNPADPRHIVEIEADTLAGKCRFNTSFDGGETWSGGVLVPPPDSEKPGRPATVRTCDIGLPGFLGLFPYEGSVVFGSGQNVYATFSSMRATGQGNSQIMMRSTDGGRSFSASVAMDNPGAPTPSYASPEVGVDPGAGDGGADRVWAMAQSGT
ncbi:MAG: hypothetical protein ACRD1K_12555, partial [Acidimicrobiales bacterium]